MNTSKLYKVSMMNHDTTVYFLYYDKLEDAISTAIDMAEHNSLSEAEAEKHTIVIHKYNPNKLNYTEKIDSFSCSWEKKYYVYLSPFETGQGFKYSKCIEPLIISKIDSMNEKIKDYISHYLKSVFLQSKENYRFQFFKYNDDTLIAEGWAYIKENSYEVKVEMDE